MKVIELLETAKCPLMLIAESNHVIMIDYDKKADMLVYGPSLLEFYDNQEIESLRLCEKVVSNNKKVYLKVKLKEVK